MALAVSARVQQAENKRSPERDEVYQKERWEERYSNGGKSVTTAVKVKIDKRKEALNHCIE